MVRIITALHYYFINNNQNVFFPMSQCTFSLEGSLSNQNV